MGASGLFIPAVMNIEEKRSVVFGKFSQILSEQHNQGYCFAS
jgi:hypothetical protein